MTYQQTPVLIGDTWHFPNGRTVPLVRGGAVEPSPDPQPAPQPAPPAPSGPSLDELTAAFQAALAKAGPAAAQNDAVRDVLRQADELARASIAARQAARADAENVSAQIVEMKNQLHASSVREAAIAAGAANPDTVARLIPRGDNVDIGKAIDALKETDAYLFPGTDTRPATPTPPAGSSVDPSQFGASGAQPTKRLFESDPGLSDFAAHMDERLGITRR